MGRAFQTTAPQLDPPAARRGAPHRAANPVLLLMLSATLLAGEAGAAVRVDVAGDPLLGNPEAPVVLVEFAHFLCLACYNFQRAVMPRIRAELVDKGSVALVHKDLPIDDFTVSVAIAAACAGEQRRFWEYHDILYARRKLHTAEDFAAYAAELELDATAFADCLRQAPASGRIRADRRAAQLLGVQATPTFLIARREPTGSKLRVLETIRGAVPFDVLAKKIRKAAAKSR